MNGALSSETFDDLRRILVRDWDKNKWYIGGVLVFTYFIWPMIGPASQMGGSAYSTKTYFRV